MRHAFLALATTLAVPVFATPAPLSGDLAAVQGHLRAVRAMTATFSQTDRSGKVLGGTLALKQPGRVRFQYERGVPILIVADGKTLNFVDYSVKQVSRWPIASSPLAVLLDPTRDIARYASIITGGDPRIVSVLAYDRKRPEYGRINLIFARDAGAPGGLMLTGWAALDAQGNRTTVRLADQRYNGAIGDETFRWDDPRKKSTRN